MIEIREANRQEIDMVLTSSWGAPKIITKGNIHSSGNLSGFSACYGETLVGLVTYRLSPLEAEIVTLNSFREKQGIGTALMNRVTELARMQNKQRVFLVTTNDNIYALKFYQRLGFDMVFIHRDQVLRSREIKPEIPKIGYFGLEIKHEIEFELLLF